MYTREALRRTPADGLRCTPVETAILPAVFRPRRGWVFLCFSPSPPRFIPRDRKGVKRNGQTKTPPEPAGEYDAELSFSLTNIDPEVDSETLTIPIHFVVA